MKCFVAVFALGLAVLPISETVCPEGIDDYLDDTFFALRTNATSLNLNPMKLPDTNFTVRVRTEEELMIIRVGAIHQVLTGISLKRLRDGSIADQKLVSSYNGEDLAINGQLILGGTYNKTCTFIVDIDIINGIVHLGLPENKTEPLCVASLTVFIGVPTVVLEEGCVKKKNIEKEILDKFQAVLKADLADIIRRPLKEALNKTLKPFDPTISGQTTSSN